MSIARATHSTHRKAFGPRRNVSPATKARFVAESILQHEIEGHTWTIQQFGVDVESAQWARVLEALGKLRQQQAA